MLKFSFMKFCSPARADPNSDRIVIGVSSIKLISTPRNTTAYSDFWARAFAGLPGAIPCLILVCNATLYTHL